MASEDKKTETFVHVAYELHDRPGMWGWDVSGRNGYGWGTAPSEREAMQDCITYLQTYNLPTS